MKKIIFSLILMVVSVFSVMGQTSCPTIKVERPEKLIKIGESVAFTARIDGFSSENLKYQWTVNGAEITNGQGTPAISILTDDSMQGRTITATIEVSGFPQNCVNSASGAGEVDRRCWLIKPRLLDEYRKISWRNEKLRLDYVVAELKSDQQTPLYILIRSPSSQKLEIRAAKIIKYLSENHKFSKARLYIVDAERGDDQTRIYLVPLGADPPY